MDKIINHCINIAVQSLNIVGKDDYVTKHDFMSALSIDKKEDIDVAKYLFRLNDNSLNVFPVSKIVKINLQKLMIKLLPMEVIC